MLSLTQGSSAVQKWAGDRSRSVARTGSELVLVAAAVDPVTKNGLSDILIFFT